jgi:hypothetical protein
LYQHRVGPKLITAAGPVGSASGDQFSREVTYYFPVLSEVCLPQTSAGLKESYKDGRWTSAKFLVKFKPGILLLGGRLKKVYPTRDKSQTLLIRCGPGIEGRAKLRAQRLRAIAICSRSRRRDRPSTPRDMAAPSTANSTKDEQRVPHLTRLGQDEEPGPDVSVLKEIGRKALIDSLNSVRSDRISRLRTDGRRD